MANASQVSSASRNIGVDLPDYLMTERADPRQVSFTPQQLDALETLYPEFYALNQTDAELRFRAGQRSVLHFIKERVRR